jgi:predicted enzyme related to lactoylglutathione lyase
MKFKNCALAGLVAAAIAAGGLLTACGTAGGSSAKSASSSISNAQFVWHDLQTRDPAAARRFYGELLGWEFEEIDAFGKPYLLAKLGERYVGGIVEMPADLSAGPQWLSYLMVGDVDAALARLEAAGGRRAVDPVDVEVGRVTVATDPQGAPVGLASVRTSLERLAGVGKDGAFAWMDYFASDPAAAASFYKQLAGFEVSQQGSAQVPYLLLKSDQVRAGVLRNPVDAVTPNWLPYVNVADISAAVQQVTALGGTVIIPPSPRLRKGTVAVIRDPTGGVLALQTNPG